MWNDEDNEESYGSTTCDPSHSTVTATSQGDPYPTTCQP